MEPGTREHRTGKVGHHATGASAGELDPDEAGPALAIDPLRSRVTMTSRVDEFISGRPAAWSSARSSAWGHPRSLSFEWQVIPAMRIVWRVERCIEPPFGHDGGHALLDRFTR